MLSTYIIISKRAMRYVFKMYVAICLNFDSFRLCKVVYHNMIHPFKPLESITYLVLFFAQFNYYLRGTLCYCLCNIFATISLWLIITIFRTGRCSYKTTFLLIFCTLISFISLTFMFKVLHRFLLFVI